MKMTMDRSDKLIEQLVFRLEFKRLCFSRAIDSGDYHDANIFAAQAEWYKRKFQRLEALTINH